MPWSGSWSIQIKFNLQASLVSSSRQSRCGDFNRRGSFCFARFVLELMPADALAAHFHDVIGRPTKELYSVAGLLLIKEFMNW